MKNQAELEIEISNAITEVLNNEYLKFEDVSSTLTKSMNTKLEYASVLIDITINKSVSIIVKAHFSWFLLADKFKFSVMNREDFKSMDIRNEDFTQMGVGLEQAGQILKCMRASEFSPNLIGKFKWAIKNVPKY